jgi:hypothetical protein
MLRSRLLAMTVLAWLLSGESSPLWAQKEWIRAGSYLDWPETFREPSGTAEARPVPATLAPDYQPVRLLQNEGFEPELEPPEFGHDLSGLEEPGWQQSAFHQAGVHQPVCTDPQLSTFGWQLLPSGVLYPSYIAGTKEPRFGAAWLWERRRGLIWETALGGRWGLFRHGTFGPHDARGFQLDVEGAALARVDPEEESDLEAVDFRAGIVATWREGPWRLKAGYYHISSHLGDEFVIKNPDFTRLNYVRDSLIIGLMYDITPDLQIYGEFAPALNANGGAEPGEFQFGIQYSPYVVTGLRGAPFWAVNGHLRQEFNFGGSVNALAGWQWRGRNSNRTFRIGAQYYSGPSIQWSFLDRYESLVGVGMWFDY